MTGTAGGPEKAKSSGEPDVTSVRFSSIYTQCILTYSNLAIVKLIYVYSFYLGLLYLSLIKKYKYMYYDNYPAIVLM